MAEDKDRPSKEPEPQAEEGKKARTLHGHRPLSDAPPPAPTPSPRPIGPPPRLRPPGAAGWSKPGAPPAPGAPTAPGAPSPTRPPLVRSKTPPPLQRVSPIPAPSGSSPPAAPAQRTVMYGTKIDEPTQVSQNPPSGSPAPPEQVEASASEIEDPETSEAELIEDDWERPTNAKEPAPEDREEKTEPNKRERAGRVAVDPSRSSRPQSVSPGAYNLTTEPQFAGAAAGSSEAPPPPSSKDAASPLEKELVARADRIKEDDPVGAARSRIEAGLVCEWMLGDRDQARAHYGAARSLVRTLQPALARIRRIGSAQTALSGSTSAANEVLSVVDDELAIAETDELRADLHAARARAFESQGNLAQARAAYNEALRFSARHAAALRGLEAVLRREILEEKKPLHGELAAHLIKLCDAFSPDGSDGDSSLAAWLCVERADIAERQMKDPAAAREALKRGVALAPGPGPVRSALVRHLAKHDRDTGLAEALRVEADRETDSDRASRLLYASARISLDRLSARGDGMAALLRADQRAAKGSPVQSRILSELVTQLEIDGDHTKIVEVRVKRLGLLVRPEAIAFEYLRLAEAYGRVGRADLAADAAARALSQDPTSVAARGQLDLALQRLGRHGERVAAWLREANGAGPTSVRVRAFLQAADIASRHLGRRDQAIDALRAAALLDPGHGEVFDTLSALLVAPPQKDEAAQKNANERVDLFYQAAERESDTERKLALLEKVAAIYEDELGRADLAIETAEKMLAVDPKRRSAVLILERNARRAGDHARLTKALLEEAAAAADSGLKARLYLEASQVADQQGDHERALSLLDKAIASKPGNAEVERARVELLKRMNRFDEARKTLVALAEHDKEATFETWLEIADLDEAFRKAPNDAVEAYRSAHKARAEHPLPALAMVRLLRSTKSYKRLVSELKLLAKSEHVLTNLAQLHTMAAEVEELCLGDDDAALKSLEAADDALSKAPDPAWDAAILESTERILFRVGDDEGLVRLYAKWLERKPPAAVDHTLRIALATTLENASPAQAVEVLEALVGVVPSNLPALRRLEHLHRARRSFQPLSNALYAMANVVTSKLARASALWEVVTLEEKLGASVTLDALARIVREFPSDTGALDTIIRVASRLVSNVGVPHPALLAARSQLITAIRARRDLTLDPVARAAYQLEEAILLESAEVDPDVRGALIAYREALGLWPDSMLAARGIERLAESLGDFPALIASQIALSKLVDSPLAKAAHLVRAADLTAKQARDDRTALELFEVALATDPSNRDAARALAQMLTNDPKRLLEQLRPALEQATGKEQVVLLGTEIGNAYLKLAQQEGEAARIDYVPGIQAVRRVLSQTGDDVATLFLLSRLYGAQKAWAEARETLQHIAEVAGSTDTKTRQRALFSLADLYEGPIGDPKLAESTLVSVLSTEPSNKTALERLYAIGAKSGDKKLARSSLERLAEFETDLSQRTEYQLRVAEVCRESNDGAGMLRALSDAIVSLPTDLRAWTLLARLYRADAQDGAAGLAHAIEQIVEMAKARRRPVETRWLITLGLLQVNMLKRHNEGLANLQAAASTSAAGGSPHPEVRAALGSGLLSAGRNKEAIQLLRELVTTDAETLLRLAEPSAFSTVRTATVAATGTVLGACLSCLDAALGTEGRPEERLAVEEVRAALGELPADRLGKLRARRLEPEIPFAGALAGSELVHTLVPEARSPLIDIAVAIQPIAAKALRFELGALGISSRERIGPRDSHPTRHFADKIARCLGIESYELYLTPSWNGAIRVYPGDPPALVGPLLLAELSESEQMFALARLLMRTALGVTWLDEVSSEVADALLLSAVRCVIPQFGAGEISAQREQATQALLPAMQRAIGRRQRRALEDLVPALTSSWDFRSFSIGVRRSEYRTAYVLSGDLLGSLDYLKRFDADIGRAADNPRVYLQHPVTNELIRYALSAEGYTERRRVGTVWALPG